MNITINSKGGIPLYEQIEKQLREKIISGELKEGEVLPSIRSFAADLRISVITIKKAYEILEQEGMIFSVPGKGFYVDNPDLNYLREKQTLGLEDKLSEWIDAAKNAGMEKKEALDMLDILW